MSIDARRDRLARLLQILVALRAGPTNAAGLARICEVSRRTIYRDLSALELAGVPVRYRPERQGYEIAPAFLFPTPRLTDREASALVVASALLARTEGPWARDGRLAVGKLLAALPAADRRRADDLAGLLEVTGGEPPPCLRSAGGGGPSTTPWCWAGNCGPGSTRTGPRPTPARGPPW